MKILLAIDSSEFSKAAIDEAATRIWPPHSIVIVLTVIDSFALTSYVGYLDPLMKNENDSARALVQSAAGELQARGIETVTQVAVGHPATTIAEQAKIWNVDLVFLGSHGHSGVARFFIGSVAKEVLRSAHCSVGIVRPATSKNPAGSKRVLLATDGSVYSEAAARSIVQRPWAKGTELRVVSIADQVIPAIDPGYAAGDAIERILEENRKQCEAAVDSACKLAGDSILSTTACVLPGVPKWRLIEEAGAWNADLIVLGSHGRRGFTRLLLGSVSEAVALNAPCSVEVIRSPELLAKG